MKVKNIFKISTLIIFIYFNSFITKGQKIEDIDSSEVYILSIFNYCTDSLNSSGIPLNEINTTNTLKVMILEKENKLMPEFQTNLITGDNKYNYISKKDTFLLSYIDSIIQKHFIANTLFLIPLYIYPLDSIDLSYSDSLTINRLTDLKGQPQIIDYKTNHYFNYPSNKDIVDNRLINDFILVMHGVSLKDGSHFSFYHDQCPFIETGTYYMLLKVKMIYIVINDDNENFIEKYKPLEFQCYNKKVYICNNIPIKLINHKKNSKNLLAIPLYVELLKPFNDINRIYMEK
jgi:hypothetical protein